MPNPGRVWSLGLGNAGCCRVAADLDIVLASFVRRGMRRLEAWQAVLACYVDKLLQAAPAYSREVVSASSSPKTVTLHI